jgi:hypothetical protein
VTSDTWERSQVLLLRHWQRSETSCHPTGKKIKVKEVGFQAEDKEESTGQREETEGKCRQQVNRSKCFQKPGSTSPSFPLMFVSMSPLPMSVEVGGLTHVPFLQ